MIFNMQTSLPWVLVSSSEHAVSTTSTSATTVFTVDCGSSIFTSASIVYVQIRDKAGPRAGYFYGNDSFFINSNKQNDSTTSFRQPAYCTTKYTPGSQYLTSSRQCGVFGYQISSAGVLTVQSQYNSTYSLTIDGTYVCKVFLLTPPPGTTLFT